VRILHSVGSLGWGKDSPRAIHRDRAIHHLGLEAIPINKHSHSQREEGCQHVNIDKAVKEDPLVMVMVIAIIMVELEGGGWRSFGEPVPYRIRVLSSD
jgi:hypothetical protein